jgi:hypothetical protein
VVRNDHALAFGSWCIAAMSRRSDPPTVTCGDRKGA